MESIINMSPEETINIVPADKYRVFVDLKDPNIQWRHGNPPSFETVNQLFEDARTKVWPKGSLEETVQNIVKSFHVEICHKTRLQDCNTINPQKFKFSVNGREGLSAEETLRFRAFNILLKNSLPQEYEYFKADEETEESAYEAFCTCFPRGFAWEVIEVYSGPPLIVFKFRHWGFFEGPYKDHSPTGELIQFYGLRILKVDSSMKVEQAHTYYDPTELLGGLLKGKKTAASQSKTQHNNDKHLADSAACPFSKLNIN